jgi:hypothetical protein
MERGEEERERIFQLAPEFESIMEVDGGKWEESFYFFSQ